MYSPQHHCFFFNKRPYKDALCSYVVILCITSEFFDIEKLGEPATRELLKKLWKRKQKINNMFGDDVRLKKCKKVWRGDSKNSGRKGRRTMSNKEIMVQLNLWTND